jgi:hypothetical protein
MRKLQKYKAVVFAALAIIIVAVVAFELIKKRYAKTAGFN